MVGERQNQPGADFEALRFIQPIVHLQQLLLDVVDMIQIGLSY